MNPGCLEQAETAGGNESMKEENRILESAHAPPSLAVPIQGV